MRVTIIKDDNTVIVNGEAYHVDCSKLPADFHALQWDGETGEVEHRTATCAHCGSRGKKPNQVLNAAGLGPYTPYLEAWEAEKSAQAKARADAVEKAKANVAG